MKIIEEQLLKETISQFKIFKNKYKDMHDLYNNLNKVKLDRLQSISFTKDNEFFDEVSLILSVISSIAAKPQISTTREEIILRAELAGHLSNDSFLINMRDTKLWKEKGVRMVPEYVHHFQTIDNLRIYENIFIGMLINLISDHIERYYDFYLNLVPSVDVVNDFSLVDVSGIDKALVVLERLMKKIRYIKNTRFYQEIKKAPPLLGNVKPTNILVKNELYKKCFKFYRKFVKYFTAESLVEDFKTYYYVLILKAFKQKKIKLDEAKKQTFKSLYFTTDDFNFNLKFNPLINLTIVLKGNKFAKAKHVLVVEANHKKDLNASNYNVDGDSVDVITIWNLFNDEPYFANTKSEVDLIKAWLDGKMKEFPANSEFFKVYCPVCKMPSIEYKNNVCTCRNCESAYTFKKGKNESNIWFMKLKVRR